MANKLLTLLLMILVLGGGFFFVLNTNILQFPQLGSTGLFFRACTNYSDNSQDCTNAVNIPIQSIAPKSVVSVKLQGATGSFKYQGSPMSWSFACLGSISFGNGQVSPITASASGTGSPPTNWPISITPHQWNLSSIYANSYGQKNITAQLGSKTSPCSLAVSFSNFPTPMKVSYRYASVASWNVNYQFASIMTSTTTSSASSTSSTTTVASTSSTATGGNTVTTTQTDIWTTTVTSASSGSGNLATSGIIVDVQPYQVQSGFAIAWVYIPPGYPLPSCGSGTCGQITIVSRDISVGAFGLGFQAARWTQASIPIAVSAGDLVLVQLFYSNQQIYNQAITVSQPTTLAELGTFQVPASPYTSQWQIQSCASGAITEGTCAVWFPSLYGTQTTPTMTSTTSASSTICGLEKLGGEITRTYCSLSIVSIQF